MGTLKIVVHVWRSLSIIINNMILVFWEEHTDQTTWEREQSRAGLYCGLGMDILSCIRPQAVVKQKVRISHVYTAPAKHNICQISSTVINLCSTKSQWSKWPKFVSLHYWHAPRGARGVKKSKRPNWSPLWWVGALRFSQNWRNCEKPSKLNKNCQRNPVF